MPAIDLKEHYLNYIATLNERRFEDLPTFVADELVYNDVQLTGRQYRELLEDDMRSIPDLFFDVQHLVVDDGYVACRIGFDCTPREPFQGREPTGSRVVFTEHVFYRFQHDRITQVWSLLDGAALNRQLPELAVPLPRSPLKAVVAFLCCRPFPLRTVGGGRRPRPVICQKAGAQSWCACFWRWWRARLGAPMPSEAWKAPGQTCSSQTPAQAQICDV